MKSFSSLEHDKSTLALKAIKEYFSIFEIMFHLC